MLETDAPYLTPHPHRGQRNEPAYVARVCTQIARLRGQTTQAISAATSQVACQFFGWKDGLCGEVQPDGTAIIA
jgi:TatD DNase family protein